MGLVFIYGALGHVDGYIGVNQTVKEIFLDIVRELGLLEDNGIEFLRAPVYINVGYVLAIIHKGITHEPYGSRYIDYTALALPENPSWDGLGSILDSDGSLYSLRHGDEAVSSVKASVIGVIIWIVGTDIDGQHIGGLSQTVSIGGEEYERRRQMEIFGIKTVQAVVVDPLNTLLECDGRCLQVIV